MRRPSILRRRVIPALLLSAFAAGCQSSGAEIPTYSATGSFPTTAYGPSRGHTPAQGSVRPVAHLEAAPVRAWVPLDELLSLARSQNPDLAAAAARVGEARGRLIQAGLYPNPTIGYSGNQINDGPGTPGQQGGFLSQEFVTGGKLKIAREAARFGVSAADWNATSKWFDTAARVKTAYYEYATAHAVLKESERMVTLFEQGLKRTEGLAAGGRVEAYDVTRLRVELTQAQNRVGTARQRIAAAERMLAVAVGVNRLQGSVSVVELADTTTGTDFEAASELAGRSSFVLGPAAEAEQARVEVRQAEVKPLPNIHLMGVGAHDYVTRAPMASVQVGVPLPLWDRNQGNILAAKSKVQIAAAGVEQARLRTVERLTIAYQKHENARRQLDLYRTKVLPDANAALEQIDKVYSAKGERFFDTLDARHVLAQARIDYAQTLGDLWSALAEIEALTQEKHGLPERNSS